MKYLKHINEFTEWFVNESKSNVVILYRGIDQSTKYQIDNNLTPDIGGFFSVDKEFASDYGSHIITCELLTNNVFNSLDPENIRKLYSAGFKLTDDYLIGIDDKEAYPTYNYEDDCFDTAEDFLKAEHSKYSTWEVIEHTDGVLDWIMGKYDACLIAEDGIINYYIDEPNKFVEILK